MCCKEEKYPKGPMHCEIYNARGPMALFCVEFGGQQAQAAWGGAHVQWPCSAGLVTL